MDHVPSNSTEFANWFLNWLSQLEPSDRLPVIIVSILFGLVAVVFIVWIVFHSIGTVLRTRTEAALKRELIERGLSAEEIATIVSSTAGKRIQNP